MRNWQGTTYCILALLINFPSYGRTAGDAPTNLSLQEDGSLVVFDAQGGVAEFVKQGTPRQAIQLDGQSCNISYGFNSAGKQTILVSLPASAATPVIFLLGDSQVTIPPKSGLRISLNESHKIEKMDGAPAGTVQFQNISSRAQPPIQLSPTPIPNSAQVIAPAPQTVELTKQTAEPAPSLISAQNPQTSESTPAKNVEPIESNINLAQPTPTTAPADPMAGQVNAQSFSPTEIGWPGKLLQSPLTETQMEEDSFYVRTEGGARFVSSMNIVNIVGSGGSKNPLIEKEIAFSTGYRQDFDIGVWLTPWFGLAIETGFALNAIRGNTAGMTVSSSTYWSVPIMAQLCFQYPNDTGFIPYLNFGFGGGWNYFDIGSIKYPGSLTLSGAGNDMNNAYQIAAGVRWRIWEQLGLTLAYKFYGTSQPTVDMGDNQQVTFGSPVTNSIELGGNFSF
jgi:opacity protein-like surface antigen